MASVNIDRYVDIKMDGLAHFLTEGFRARNTPQRIIRSDRATEDSSQTAGRGTRRSLSGTTGGTRKEDLRIQQQD